jgi:hypothetical protein
LTGQSLLSRQELPDELFQRIPAVEGDALIELVHGGIDLALDAFAFYGYDAKAFCSLLDGDADILQPKSGLRWWCKVTRRLIVGYVRPEHLTDVEQGRPSGRPN